MKPLPAVVLAVLFSSAAFGADRPTDRDIAALIERIDQGRDRFEDALDGELKRKVLRGPSGEVDVDRYLDDFDENIDRLKDRLKPDYAASIEVATVLRQASAIEAFFRKQAPGTQGESEWNRLATDLKSLASAYSAAFPLAENAVVRRRGDREVAAAAEEIARGASRLKRSLDSELKKDTSVDASARQAIVREADQLERDAKTLGSRLKDGEPSSAEAARLFERARQLQSFLDGHRTVAAANAWTGMAPHFPELAAAYAVSWPQTR